MKIDVANRSPDHFGVKVAEAKQAMVATRVMTLVEGACVCMAFVICQDTSEEQYVDTT